MTYTKNTKNNKKDILSNLLQTLYLLFSKRKILLTSISLIATVICIFCVSTIVANGQSKPLKKTYVSVEVEEGDTLWNIADTYNDSSITSLTTKEYVEQIKSINQIGDDTINSGNYVIVPVYYIAEH